ncbi:MAG TPA: proline--tRNA ligase [Candidatus Lambdaproteobacteria bacterium]|nr:proline--tRNA ligase [SAR324 cluster bacterium]HBL54742.1 proline--tRNA ligase [Deltaproteobacteria bacterium]HIA55963.1 proline--tRNA ligase [Candidatus Lambdaproteobacteria bacterium]HIB46498.1 proline--tRNA ligase [Candidatus Lambdaproteobacteria bacterium]HIB93293.1 proline--tRNA ligase [Candidatus Lambdaproteobacteria bacterium]
MAKNITPRKENYSQWYLDVIAAGQLADYAPVKGCMVIRPTGYAIWEAMQARLDRMFKETGHVNASFPLLIPKHFMEREAEHVEGFSPECAVVTHGGGKKLDEPLIIRPTSETVVGHMYSQWIHSYRDLPVLINQWCNVLRWEMRTRLFLRTSEFLWQEGHTAHETAEEAQEETLRMLEIYRVFQEEYLAIPVVKGLKSEAEKFPGALATYSIEAMMQDGKALQSGTSHNLGQNFAKAFDIDYLDRNNNQKYVWTTSWGVSTRMIGGLIMTHSDDDGLIIPPKIAPIQVVIVPIFNNDQERGETLEFADSIAKLLYEKIDELQIKIDRRNNLRPADKFFHWIQQGVPVRIEVGPRDVKKQSAMVARRDIREKNEVSLENITQRVVELLDNIQDSLFQRALDYRKSNTRTVAGFGEFKEIINNEGGFIYAHWDGSKEVETKIKQDTKATIRCIPLEKSGAGKCMVTGAPSAQEVLFAIAY